jgi:acetyl-CoA acetyltransferase
MSLRGKCAIAGLGATRMGKNYDHSHALGFAIEAVELAIEDAGLSRSDIDGLLVNPGVTWSNTMASFALQQAMGMRDLRLTSTMNAGGATAGSMVMHAAQSIAAGMANAVACVFADAPLKPPKPQARKMAGQPPPTVLRADSTLPTGFSASTPSTLSSLAATCIYMARPTTIWARSRSPSANGPT